MKSFRPMYIFTVLSGLLMAVLWVVTHSALATELNTLLTATSGGILALLGTVVNFEFGSAKGREQAARSGDAGHTEGVAVTETRSTTTASTETKI